MFRRRASPFDSIADRVWKPGSTFDTTRTRAVLAELGDPHADLRVVHVAGTNGKGSVTALTAAGFAAAGHKVGRFTSPPLTRYADQVRLDGEVFPDKAARRYLDEVTPWLDAQDDAPTGFELMFAFACAWWRDAGADVAVVEAGLGGTRDATNVFPKPLATVVTNVTEDHLAIIGPTIEDAARDKAGIARPGVPLITAAEGDALAALLDAAGAAGADPLRVAGLDFDVVALASDYDGTTFTVTGLQRAYPDEMHTVLSGAHQATNAALALAALDAADAAGVAVPVDAAVKGLATAQWPGRLTSIDGPPRLLLDSAHNPAAADALVAFLKENDLRPTIVFGCLEDKPWLPMVRALAERGAAAVCTRPDSPRALDPSQPAREFSRAGVVATVAEDPTVAFEAAVAQTPEDGTVLVTGSTYLLGTIMRRLGVEP